MGHGDGPDIDRGKWLALTAALLGWMFDGLEQGLFPLAGRPALGALLATTDEKQIGLWYAVITAAYLVGAATGGVLFGWLGDRIGRVRAMTLSILTYALCSGLCGLAASAEQIAVLRFLASVGMGGEWSLGVALVMELWPERSRSLLAGLIGAAANVGYMLIALVGLGLSKALPSIEEGLLHSGLSQSLVGSLVGDSGWRLLFMMGALPALLTFLIRLYVPESERWRHEQGRGTTAHWATRDLIGVLIGSAAACAIIVLWKQAIPLGLQVIGTVAALVVATLGYLFPVIRYLQRHGASREGTTPTALAWQPTVRRMLLGACLGGVALLGTWGSMQWAAPWADKLTGGQMPEAKEYTQLCAGIGAVVGTIGGALLGGWLGRRLTYTFLCLGSLAAALLFFLGNQHYGPLFLVLAFVAGMFTASFYGWLPLYLPELFPTRVRATGQGFSYNFGRILATVGVLQTGALMGLFDGSYPRACSIMSLIYLVGVAIIWLAPETRGQPLPE